jgi:hypothetical protein
LLCLLAVLAPAALRADSDRVMVGEDIYVAEGEDLNDAVCIGCSIRVDGKVRDAVAIGGSIEVTGEVHDAVSIGGGLDVRGKVSGDAVVIFGSTRVREGGRIRGDAVSILGSVRTADSGSVGGDIVSSESWAPIALSGVVIGLIVFLVFGIVIQPLLVLLCFTLLGERRIAILAETARRRSGMSFLIGIALCIGSFILSIAAAMTPIISLQIPFGLILFCVLVVGYAGVSYWVGRGMLPRSGALGAAILGAVLVTIIQLIPIVGQPIRGACSPATRPRARKWPRSWVAASGLPSFSRPRMRCIKPTGTFSAIGLISICGNGLTFARWHSNNWRSGRYCCAWPSRKISR